MPMWTWRKALLSRLPFFPPQKTCKQEVTPSSPAQSPIHLFHRRDLPYYR